MHIYTYIQMLNLQVHVSLQGIILHELNQKNLTLKGII